MPKFKVQMIQAPSKEELANTTRPMFLSGPNGFIMVDVVAKDEAFAIAIANERAVGSNPPLRAIRCVRYPKKTEAERREANRVRAYRRRIAAARTSAQRQAITTRFLNNNCRRTQQKFMPGSTFLA